MKTSWREPTQFMTHPKREAEAVLHRETVVLVRWAVEWWEALNDMQDFASSYCARRFSGDLGDRARMASNELLENAVRYAIPGSEVVYEVRELKNGFAICVSNEAVSSRIVWLEKRISELRIAHSEDAYRAAVRRLIETGDRGIGGGLGLLRVRHEANVELSVTVTGKHVTVMAVGETTRFANTTGLSIRR